MMAIDDAANASPKDGRLSLPMQADANAIGVAFSSAQPTGVAATMLADDNDGR